MIVAAAIAIVIVVDNVEKDLSVLSADTNTVNEEAREPNFVQVGFALIGLFVLALIVIKQKE